MPKQTCWYCGKRLGRVYYRVKGLKGRYCLRCARLLAKKYSEIIRDKDGKKPNE